MVTRKSVGRVLTRYMLQYRKIGGSRWRNAYGRPVPKKLAGSDARSMTKTFKVKTRVIPRRVRVSPSLRRWEKRRMS